MYLWVAMLCFQDMDTIYICVEVGQFTCTSLGKFGVTVHDVAEVHYRCSHHHVESSSSFLILNKDREDSYIFLVCCTCNQKVKVMRLYLHVSRNLDSFIALLQTCPRVFRYRLGSLQRGLKVFNCLTAIQDSCGCWEMWSWSQQTKKEGLATSRIICFKR